MAKYTNIINSNKDSGVCTAEFNLDGRTIARSIAPYKREFERYNVGR